MQKTLDSNSGMAQKFDIDYGYQAMSSECRSSMQRIIPSGECDLLRNGIEKLSILSKLECIEIRRLIDNDGEQLRQRGAKIPIL